MIDGYALLPKFEHDAVIVDCYDIAHEKHTYVGGSGAYGYTGAWGHFSPVSSIKSNPVPSPPQSLPFNHDLIIIDPRDSVYDKNKNYYGATGPQGPQGYIFTGSGVSSMMSPGKVSIGPIGITTPIGPIGATGPMGPSKSVNIATAVPESINKKE